MNLLRLREEGLGNLLAPITPVPYLVVRTPVILQWFTGISSDVSSLGVDSSSHAGSDVIVSSKRTSRRLPLSPNASPAEEMIGEELIGLWGTGGDETHDVGTPVRWDSSSRAYCVAEHEPERARYVVTALTISSSYLSVPEKVFGLDETKELSDNFVTQPPSLVQPDDVGDPATGPDNWMSEDIKGEDSEKELLLPSSWLECTDPLVTPLVKGVARKAGGPSERRRNGLR
ncbi:hypothetical protein EDD16DRAFT_1529002 [Pisolithus croceorrhizus]|nr:hypothetical protein EDD16DRAFT_1529002 [Pisolithus croceorrhizus]KAI6097691.1 hypothetical protein EV401DRAFT_1895448 [Pisolithus croceorrhizus]